MDEMLDQSDITHYLAQAGLVKHDTGLTVADASRRNRVFVADVPGGPTYVVKQGGARSAATLAHEADVLRALATVPDLAAGVPAVVHQEADAARVVLRTASGGRDWNAHHAAVGFPRLTARVLGRTLAAVHRLSPAYVDGLPPGLDPMWGLSLAEPPHDLVLDLSAGAQDLVGRLQAGRALCDRLERLRGDCAADRLAHGDLRWDNCIALAPAGAHRRTRVLLIDWELAGAGCAAFDVGTVLAEYLRLWVGSVPIVEPADPARLLACARHPLRTMRPAIHAFWGAYGGAADRPPALRRVVELAAVSLLQMAVERAQRLSAASAHVVTLVQVADNMLRRPDDAARALLGLAP